MELLQLFYFLRQYNADVAVIGGAVAAACFFLEKLLGAKISAKLLVFLPFLLGGALYFAYGALFVGDVAENAGLFLKYGFSCGSFATAARVVCAQFLGKGSAGRETVRAECAKRLLLPYRTLTDEEAERICELARTDEEAAKPFILGLCERAPETAAELVLGALREI